MFVPSTIANNKSQNKIVVNERANLTSAVPRYIGLKIVLDGNEWKKNGKHDVKLQQKFPLQLRKIFFLHKVHLHPKQL